jgi:hypothetical protein
MVRKIGFLGYKVIEPSSSGLSIPSGQVDLDIDGSKSEKILNLVKGFSFTIYFYRKVADKY